MRTAVPRRSALSLFFFAILAWSGWRGLQATFATVPPAQGGLSQKQRHGSIRNKNLGEVLEIPLEEPVEELPPKLPMPEHRLPYTMHVAANYPNGHHLKEDSKNLNFIKDKITHAFERFEEIISNVEVHLEVNDNFHRDKALAPYVFQILATLKNRQVITVSNPEKHARPTLQEALDHTLDVMRKSLKDHKEKQVHQAKKARKNAMPDEDPVERESLDADALADELAMAADMVADAEDERLYSLKEDDSEEQGQAATTPAGAAARSKPVEESIARSKPAEESNAKTKSQGTYTTKNNAPNDLREVLMAGL